MDKEGLSHILNTCDECGSEYYINTSRMANLCPQCAHLLYGYENCSHLFKDGRCVKCFWNGHISQYLNNTKEEIHKKIIHVYDSYKFSDGRIIAFLKSADGKISNLTTVEDSFGSQWKIKQYLRTTGSVDSYIQIEKEESQSIFQYLLEGINQNEKPIKGSKLEITICV